MAVLVPVLFIGGTVMTYRVWARHGQTEKKAELGVGEQKSGTKAAAVPVVAATGRAAADESWRVVGYYSAGPAGVFVLQSGERVRYVYAPSGYRVGMLNVEVIVDEKLYSSYGGGAVPGGVGGIVGAKR